MVLNDNCHSIPVANSLECLRVNGSEMDCVFPNDTSLPVDKLLNCRTQGRIVLFMVINLINCKQSLSTCDICLWEEYDVISQ